MDPPQSPRSSRVMLRLRWPVFSSLDAIQVLDDPLDASSPQQPFVLGNHTPSKEQDHHRQGAKLHPVAAEPATNPPVPSLTVAGVFAIDDWATYWYEIHDTNHMAPYEPQGGVDKAPCVCCGARPFQVPSPLVVTASDAPFVTIGDYVVAVRAWLLGLEETILQIMDALDGLVEEPGVEGYEATRRLMWFKPEAVDHIAWEDDEYMGAPNR